MSAHADIGQSSNYLARLFALVLTSLAQLARSPSHARRDQAARKLARLAVLLSAIVVVVIVALMVGLDAWEIGLMPPRGTANLWPVRILTEFGKDKYVLCLLALSLVAVAIVAAAMRGRSQARLLGFGLRLEFLFLAVLAPLLAGEAIKLIAGRGRPFVGGKANPFNFVPFTGSEAYASFPSAHAITAFALAFAVGAVWPRMRGVMIAYALVIAFTRLVLLAHHPSDVVAGALIGVVGAMGVRYWFAARGLGFAIDRDGTISALGPGRLKRVARGASSP
jgi:membrane-associated phospholipid phosphatase